MRVDPIGRPYLIAYRYVAFLGQPEQRILDDSISLFSSLQDQDNNLIGEFAKRVYEDTIRELSVDLTPPTQPISTAPAESPGASESVAVDTAVREEEKEIPPDVIESVPKENVFRILACLLLWKEGASFGQ